VVIIVIGNIPSDLRLLAVADWIYKLQQLAYRKAWEAFESSEQIQEVAVRPGRSNVVLRRCF
jgi:hypothetical protein